MKHFTFSAALCVLMCSSFASLAQNVVIPDSNFKAALVGNAQINKNGDSEIQTSEAAAFKGTLNVQNLGIQDLTGVEAFTAIPRLYCNNNLLTSLNVSQNTALVALRCNHNQIASLDVSNNIALTELRCYVNRLSSLNGLGNLTNLQVLQAFQNMFTSFGVARNTQLRELNISFNQVGSLDLRDNHMLTYLDVKKNSLKYVIMQNGNNSNVTYFNALQNPNLLCIEVDNVAYSEANWTNIDSHSQFSSDCGGDLGDIIWFQDANFQAALVADRHININGDNYIQGVEARNFTGSIYVPNKNISDITGIDLFPKATELIVNGNNLQWVSTYYNKELRVIKVHNNPLESIDVTQNSKLTTLTAHNTPLTSLDLSGNPELTSLWCFDSQLAALDLTHNNKLVDVQLNHNRLTSLQIGEQPNLTTLLAYQNQLTSIDVSHAPALTVFRIQLNKLTAIDLAINSSLRELNVGDNLLTALDVTGKPGIRVVDCYNNQLTTLDISQNPTVFALRAYRNKLTELNVKNGNNRVIRTFDVTKNPNLTCIQVDDPAWSEANWTMTDPQANFSTDCGYAGPEVVNIPDANFRERLYTLGVDTNGDRKIQYTEAEAFTDELMMVGAGVKDATGVEAFINVARMNWEHNDITKLDLRQNSGLRSISCGITPLTDLQVNPGLQLLECYDTPLATLNLYNNNSLKYIDFSNTQITSFDIDEYGFASTLEFFAGNAPIVMLDIRAAANLETFALGGSSLWIIDLSKNTNLQSVSLHSNPNLELLNVKNGNNTNMDLEAANHPKLICIEVDDVAYAEANYQVQAHNHFSTDCDGSETPVNIPDPNFKRVLVNNPELNTNHDSEIQITEAKAYSGHINAIGQNISDLTGFEVFENTTSIDVTDNNLTSIILNERQDLRELFCGNNQINQFGIWSAPNLTRIICPNNRMEFLVLPSRARVVDASNNLIGFFTPPNRPTLERLYLNGNQLTQLEITTENSGLEVLHVANNNLTWLDIQVAGADGLFELEAQGNDLTCIKVNDPAYAETNWRDNVDAEATFSEDCEGNPHIVYIPDPNLKEVLVSLVDGNSDYYPEPDGEVQDDEAANFYGGIYASDLEIRDLTGIGAFYNAGWLDCSNNQITRLDEVIGAYDAGLDISNNQIAEITTSLRHLSYFKASHNRLSELPELNYIRELLVDHNELTSIDGISTENYIGIIHAEFNKIASIDFGNYNELYELHLNDNLLTSVDITGIYVENVNISVVNVGNNRLTSLNLKNGENEFLTSFNAIGNPDLTCIQVDDAEQAEASWRDNVDASAQFSENCGSGDPEVVNIPDAAFRARLIELGVDTNNDSKIQYTEAEAFTNEMILVGAGIADATGVEAFTNVSRMDWEHNSITSLDVRLNTGLRSLSCGNNAITSLHINPQLEVLECYSSNLTSLDLQNNGSLKYLDFSSTQVTAFDLADYPFAATIQTFGGSATLIELDLSTGASLTFVGVIGSRLTQIDLSSNHNLTKVRMSNNSELQFLNIKNGNNTNVDEFDVSNCPKLTCVEVDDVEYAEEHFEVGSQTHFSEDCDNSEAIVYIPDPAFKQQLVANDQINRNFDSEIQKSEANEYYGELWLANKGISDLTGIEEFHNIETLDISENNITRLFLDNHDRIGYLAARNNQINALSIYACDYMYDLDVRGNRLESLAIPPRLESLNASNNLITSVDIHIAPTLRYVILNNNRLTRFDLTEANPYVEVLDVSTNNLTWLNLEIAQRGGLGLAAKNNDLTCVQVDDPAYAEANWRDDVDAEVTFSTSCEGDPNVVYIPDPNLKAYLLSIADGRIDDVRDGKIQYQEAAQVDSQIDFSGMDVADVTGLNAFGNVEWIVCSNNRITRIHELPNSLTGLECENNLITEITIVPSNLAEIEASNNRLTSLPVIPALINLIVDNNQITSLDLTQSPYLSKLNIGNNQLTALNLSNRIYTDLNELNTIGNPDLTCIEVDDADVAEANWRDNVDPHTSFSEDCAGGEAFRVAVSPNPTMGRMKIESTRAVDEVQIMDGISGDMVGSASGPELDISGLSNGVYLLRVRCGEKVMTTRVVKQ